MPRVSEFYELKRSQSELDFVDVPLHTDIKLFVDPYALSVGYSGWFAAANNLVVSFFDEVLKSIKASDNSRAMYLLSSLHEPNETHLGYSARGSAGRGVGKDQAKTLFQQLSASKAVRTGRLEDLSDCELIIPGVSTDKISDITINVIRGLLIDYTVSQCSIYNIPTSTVGTGACWTGQEWRNNYANIPVPSGNRLILVPKAAVRFHLAVESKAYYRGFVLDYLKAEHLTANDALVHTLKNGKQVVYKKELESKYPFSKEFLFEFSEEHPEVLSKFKSSLPQRATALSNEQIEIAQSASSTPIDYMAQISELKTIQPGNNHAGKFHNFILGALQAIFYPSLINPKKERELNEGRKRIDIVFDNEATAGFFHGIIHRHNIHAPYIFFECKNYSSDPDNPEFDQLIGRFGEKRGKFGILVCRTLSDTTKAMKRCRDVINAGQGTVMMFTDNDIIALLDLRSKNNENAINQYMEDRIQSLLFDNKM